MTLWIIMAAITAALLAAVLWPLYRRQSHDVDRVEAALAVYRDQLAELDRDAARGLIASDDAHRARNEISRRMLTAAADARRAATEGAGRGARRAAFVLAAVGIPAASLSLYLVLGRPDLPGLPQAERLATAVERNDFAAMVAQVEAHLAQNPADAEGWLVLAPAYRRLGRYGEAAEAFGRALDLVPPTAGLLTEHGEALVLANEGIVTARARKAFEQALELDKSSPKARFYRALADRQEGKREEALAAWRGMLADGPPDAPWRSAVERQIASLEREMSGAPQLTEEDIAGAQSMSPEDRQATIRGMVDRLASRLKENGHDLDGWLRLARARAVLGETEAAAEALGQAEVHFKDDQASLTTISETRKALGLDKQ